MDRNIVIVADKAIPFARHIEKFGLHVYAIGMKISDVQGAVLTECGTIYWQMSTMANPRTYHLVRSLLLSVPRNCFRILDFNLKTVDTGKAHLISLSLKCCDLLKTDIQDFRVICPLLGLRFKYLFDNGFELMRQFRIQTLILTHGTIGCHVFQGSQVSEKRGAAGLSFSQSDDAEGAFLAAFYVASSRPDRPLSECHRIAFDYMCRLYANV